MIVNKQYLRSRAMYKAVRSALVHHFVEGRRGVVCDEYAGECTDVDMALRACVRMCVVTRCGKKKQKIRKP